VEEWSERWQESEIHRTRGLLFAAAPAADIAHAEQSLMRAVTVAREQRALGWELRATLSLARLLQTQRRDNEARELLEPVLAAFHEGSETADVRDARVCLLTLS
jgi:predicted ATPase